MAKCAAIDFTEEAIANPFFATEYGKLRRFRIEYINNSGQSNLEGVLYFPDNLSPYVILEKLTRDLNKLFVDSAAKEST